MKKYFIYLPILLIVIAIPVALILLNKEKSNHDGNTTLEENSDPQGTILVEAGEGTLVEGGTFSYIQESARGLEAYLGDKGASAVYTFESPSTGDHTLWVKLTDDGLYTPGTRDVTIVVNDSKTLAYNHIPEDTKGWKWYEIGITPLTEGENTIVFTKNEDSAGAYVMDEFKLIPNVTSAF